MVAPTTAMDALVAELLGDVGKVHEGVKTLSKTVPEMASTVASASADAEMRLAAVVSQLEKQVGASRTGLVAMPRWQLLLTLAACGALGGLVALFALRTLTPTQLLSGSAAQTYQSGQWIERAWPHLNSATQAVVKQAADK